MKRIISALLLVAMCCLLLTGCMCKHEWKDATCTTPTTCTLCNKTEGEPTGHIPGDLVSGEIDFASKTSLSYQRCRICSEYLSNETVSLTSMVNGSHFIFTPNQFNDGMESYYAGTYTMETDTLDSGALISMIYDASGSSIGAIMYLNGGDSLTMSDADSALINGMICYWYTEDNAVIIDAMTGLLCGCDASYDEQGALNALSAMIDAYPDTYTTNGFNYTVTLNDGDFVFLISID